MNIWKTQHLKVRAMSLASQYKEEKLANACCTLEKSLLDLPGFQDLWMEKKVKHWNFPDLKSYSLGFSHTDYARNYLLLKEVQDEL